MTHPGAHAALARMMMAVLVVAVASGLDVSPRAANGAATRRLATILLDFTHVATKSQREELHAILHDETATADERGIAVALLHMEHIVRLEDYRRLETMTRDASTADGVRVLAEIIKNMTHTLTPSEREGVLKLLRSEGV
jgi:hypothetical protein